MSLPSNLEIRIGDEAEKKGKQGRNKGPGAGRAMAKDNQMTDTL